MTRVRVHSPDLPNAVQGWDSPPVVKRKNAGRDDFRGPEVVRLRSLDWGACLSGGHERLARHRRPADGAGRPGPLRQRRRGRYPGACDLKKVARVWAIPVHKFKGSAFRNVIFPVVRSRVLDRTLIYTAVTGAVDTCVLVGDRAFIRAAVQAERALSRRSRLDFDAPMEGMDP